MNSERLPSLAIVSPDNALPRFNFRQFCLWINPIGLPTRSCIKENEIKMQIQ